MSKLSLEAKLKMWENLEMVQQTFPYTVEGLTTFAQECIHELIPGKPDLNQSQSDILAYMLTGKKYRMVQAQRGQSKSTLAGIYAAFTLLHVPHYRILIFSQTSKRATEIAGWVVKIFKRLDFLEFMLPDRNSGDKDSTEAFDIHHVLKGGDKSPSVSCYSITSGAQGARADLIIPDDIESLQNSRTVSGREWLEEQAKEFESINQHGDILYLGTPQSMDSMYNNLPGRGYDIRIWPGRYPTAEEETAYGEHLAHSIRDKMTLDPSLRHGFGPSGLSGAPTCPEMFDDETLVEKEISQGKAKFQLQFMLNTRLSDLARFPLKPNNLIVTHFSMKEGPALPIWNNSPENRIQTTLRPGNRESDKFFRPIPKQYEWLPFERRVMYIDPAGGGANGDETAYAIVYQLGNLLYLYDMGGVPGGYDETALSELVRAAKAAGVHEVYVEKNYGHGAHMAILKPMFERDHPVTLEEDYSTGQKEMRIIDSLEPLLGAHRLVVNETLLEKDDESTKKYPAEKRKTYQLFAQMSNVTYDKNCLKHDDRLEALASACRILVGEIDYDYTSKLDAQHNQKAKEFQDMMLDPRRRREWFGAGGSPKSSNMNQFSAKLRSGSRKW